MSITLVTSRKFYEEEFRHMIDIDFPTEDVRAFETVSDNKTVHVNEHNAGLHRRFFSSSIGSYGCVLWYKNGKLTVSKFNDSPDRLVRVQITLKS